LINFFVNNSSRALCLALSLAAAAAIIRYLDRGRWTALAGIIAMLGLCTAFSPIIGLIAAAALGSSLAMQFVWNRLSPQTQEASASQSILAAMAVVVACLLPLPTYAHLFERSGGSGAAIGIRPGMVLTIFVSAAPLLALAVWGALRADRHRRFLTALVVSGVGLMVANMVVRLPASNESNLFHVAAFLMAIPAAGAFSALQAWTAPSRRLITASLVVLLASTPLLVLYAYWHRPAIPMALDGQGLRLVGEEQADRAQLMSWIHSSTTRNAVFITSTERAAVSRIGNVPDFPALADRSLFVAQGPDYVVDVFPDSRFRHELAEHALAGQALTPEEQQYLSRLARPIWLLVESADADVLAAVEGRYGPAAFHAGSLLVFHVVG
jgi:hypothetical protein